jgi:hypothetical protein
MSEAPNSGSTLGIGKSQRTGFTMNPAGCDFARVCRESPGCRYMAGIAGVRVTRMTLGAFEYALPSSSLRTTPFSALPVLGAF